MSYSSQHEDYLTPEKSQLPTGLNVLTILSFIGSGVQIVGAIVSFIMLPFSVKMIQQTPLPENNPALKPFSGFLKMSHEATFRQYEHRYILLIVSLACAALCIYGALQMRQRKKLGFTFYTIGEAIWPIALLTLVGVFSAAFYLLIAALFVILFSLQRKHLIR